MNRTRSMTRPRREAVETMSAPQPEMRTAGVIIAVSTAWAVVEVSMARSQSTQ